ncbi:MAG: hypothetical protein GX640_04175 [Fibrobacter sp.]|nr:hypothetical protein [Fibrobacter sp.]
MNKKWMLLLLFAVIGTSYAQIDSTANVNAVLRLLQNAEKIENAMMNAEKVIGSMQELLAMQWWWGIVSIILLPVPVIISWRKSHKLMMQKKESLYQTFKKLDAGNFDEAKNFIKNEWESYTIKHFWLFVWIGAQVVFLIGWVFLLGYSNVS